MTNLRDKLVSIFSNRWLIFVAAMWIQSWAGTGYLFGSISPVIKHNLNYNQRQIARLGVAKDLGDSIGFFAGSLCELLPFWATLFVGALKNFIGYGWVWLIVTSRAPTLPLWAMCILIFIGTNGETYFNTVSLVSCVQNFPKSRGPVVGILKGFAGLSGAILTQIYAILHSPNNADLIFMIAVGPAMVAIGLMFVIRPVGGHRQVGRSDSLCFTSIYSVCLLLAAYLMAVMLLEDLIDLSSTLTTIFTLILLIIIVIPVLIPLILSLGLDPIYQEQEHTLLSEPRKQDDNEVIVLSEVEDEKPKEVDLLPENERQKRIVQLQARLMQAAADGAVKVKRRKGPRRGEDFTLAQALVKADFWLLFSALLFGSGTGLTVIDNLGQITESLGYSNTHIFISMISIWNFLGRIGGGYFSEIITRDFAYPRPLAMAVAQSVMVIGHIFIAMGWPGVMYVSTLVIGFGYGVHLAVVPATASELFGLKKFGALYNFLTMALPLGSFVFSSLIASSIYDSEAEKQAHNKQPQLYGLDGPPKCEGTTCFFLTSLIMAGFCVLAAVLTMILVYRTKIVYAHLYGKSRTTGLS